MSLTWITYDRLHRDIVQWCQRLPRRFDLIAGIPRSGVLVANMMGHHLHRQSCSLDELAAGVALTAGVRMKGAARPVRRVLVVDDTVSAGGSMKAAREALKGLDVEIQYGAVYVTPGKGGLVDYHHRAIKQPRLFAWNWLHHSLMRKSCWDIDGVLTADPEPGVDDDGPRYLKYLKTAKPNFISKHEILALVTCRLEKYRKPTVEWLARHGVRYKNLVMMQYKTRAERIKARKHAEFKAAAYKRFGAALFVESNSRQANKIALLTGLPVLCTSDMRKY